MSFPLRTELCPSVLAHRTVPVLLPEALSMPLIQALQSLLSVHMNMSDWFSTQGKDDGDGRKSQCQYQRV